MKITKPVPASKPASTVISNPVYRFYKALLYFLHGSKIYEGRLNTVVGMYTRHHKKLGSFYPDLSEDPTLTRLRSFFTNIYQTRQLQTRFQTRNQHEVACAAYRDLGKLRGSVARNLFVELLGYLSAGIDPSFITVEAFRDLGCGNMQITFRTNGLSLVFEHLMGVELNNSPHARCKFLNEGFTLRLTSFKGY